MPCKWSSVHCYHFYQYLRHLNTFSYHSLNSSVCFCHLYLLHLALHGLQEPQEENLHLHPDLQYLQDHQWLLHPDFYLLQDEYLLLHPDLQDNYWFLSNYLSFNRFFILLIRNCISCYGFIHCSKVCRIFTTGFFKKHLRFNRFFIMLIRNGSRFHDFFFFWAGLRDHIAYSLLGGGIPSQNSGYNITRLCRSLC